MRLVFADSGYWIASINLGDELSERARLVAASLGSFRIITSEMVLIEVFNHFQLETNGPVEPFLTLSLILRRTPTSM